MTKARDKFRVVNEKEKVVLDRGFLINTRGELLTMKEAGRADCLYEINCPDDPDNLKVQRSTGKLDKEGVEIFEGDFDDIASSYTRNVISWDDELTGFEVLSSETPTDMDGIEKWFTITGNILLEGE